MPCGYLCPDDKNDPTRSWSKQAPHHTRSLDPKLFTTMWMSSSSSNALQASHIIGFTQPRLEFWALWSCGEQKNAKMCLPLGITTKSDFVFAQPRPNIGGSKLPSRYTGQSVAPAADPGNPKRLQLARRQTLKCRQAWNNMEGLFVNGIDRHLRRAKQARIIKRADL